MLEQAVATEQLGRVTNALGWCGNNPQSWMLKACSAQQNREMDQAAESAHEMHECYAITEAMPVSDVDAIKATGAARRRPLHPQRREVACDQRQPRQFMIFQAKLTDGPESRQPLPVLRRAQDARHRACPHRRPTPHPTAPTSDLPLHRC